MYGRVVKHENFIDPSEVQLNISDLGSGMYIFKLVNGGNIITKKIL